MTITENKFVVGGGGWGNAKNMWVLAAKLPWYATARQFVLV